MKKLEEYIQHHRHDFDLAEAPGWASMQKAMQKKKRLTVTKKWLYFSAAASVAILFVLVINTKNTRPTISTQQTTESIKPQENISIPKSSLPEVKETAPVAHSMPPIITPSSPGIREYYQMIQSLESVHPDLSKEFLNDMQALENTESGIQKQLHKDPGNLYLLKALQYVQAQKNDIIQKQLRAVQHLPLNPKKDENSI